MVLKDDVLFEKEVVISRIVLLFSKKQFKQNGTAAIMLNIFYFNAKKDGKNALHPKHYDEYKDKCIY